MPDYDVIIIGGGPGGMSALLWCQRLNLRGLLLEQAAELGGQMRLIPDVIPDYPGLITKDGRELRDHFVAHLEQLSLEWRVNCQIELLDFQNQRLTCNGKKLTARAFVIATGVCKRWLNVPGEAEFLGTDISDHAIHAQTRFAGREVAVIGGGDSAFEDAFILAQQCPRVTLIHRSEDFRARRAWIERVIEQPNIRLLTNAELIQFSGNEQRQLTNVIVRHRQNGERQTIPIRGAVVQIGIRPNTAFLQAQVKLDDEGFIRVAQNQQTSVRMVYAIGDVTRPVCLSVVTAAGQGAVAIKHIAEILRLENA